jgi:putative endonuclease
MNTRFKGKEAEQLAITYLQNKAYKLIETNFFIKGGEIDLIMKDRDFVVFIEVKSLFEASDFSIYQSITSSKKKHLRKTIGIWLLRNHWVNKPWRVDFLGIVIGKDKTMKIEHFEFIDINRR